MMNIRDKVQYFVNRYFGAIRIFMLVVIAILLIGAIVNITNNFNRSRLERQQYTDTIIEKTSGQFQALCVVIINTSGHKALSQLDPDTANRCIQALADKDK